MVEIKLGGKKGGIALVSDEDYEKVKNYYWNNENNIVTGRLFPSHDTSHNFMFNLYFSN